ncbi:cytochrome P450 [Aspergillus taichungensis]|uniref:Cytochrome P450 n=1 Tax=Aspergillus taichungensis TaxID=482145 RepID=A0A2J5HWY4_9EURO|nr:cytochrome P450 [Aspergillus taichungensis]
MVFNADDGSGLITAVGQFLMPASWSQVLLLAFLGYILLNQVRHYQKTPANVATINFPAVYIPLISSWIAAIRFMKNPVESVCDGMAKSKNGLVRIATLQGEFILATDRHKLAEYIKAPDSILNAQDGSNDQQQIPFTMGYGVGHRTYHTAVVRGPITQNIIPKTPMMLDEALRSFDDLIGTPVEETPIALYSTIAMTVARVANRIYVGTELCRNEEFLRNATDYAEAVVISAEVLRNFPEWMKGFLVRLLPVTSYRRQGRRLLAPLIQDRLDGKLDANGEKHNDLIQWLIDAAPPVEKTIPQLAERVMALNVASIHTTTMTFTAALYSLAAEPTKYGPALREEVMANLEQGEITAATLSKLPKMESFLRESGRFNSLGLMAMQRNARKEFRFSDGTVLPPGAKIGSPSLFLHRDPEVFEDPEMFNGFRFYQPHPEPGTKPKTMLNTDVNFHLFGHGRHPCPGRFLAVHEMKLMFAILLLRYDIRLKPDTKPQPFWIGTMSLPDTKLEVIFKARK